MPEPASSGDRQRPTTVGAIRAAVRAAVGTSCAATLCAAAVLAPAASGQKEAPAEAPAAVVHPFRFRWPVPCDARVTETTENEVAKTSKVVRYRIWLEKAAEGRGLRLRLDGVEYVPPADAPVEPGAASGPDPAWVEKLRPNLRIWDEGECLGAVDYEKTLETFLAGVDKNEREFQREFLARNPEIRRDAENELTRFWTDWVGRWNGITLAEAGTHAVELTETFPDGKRLRMAGTVRHHGVPDDERRLVEVSYEAVLAGGAAVEQALAAAAEGSGDEPAETARVIGDAAHARRSVHVRAVLERATLRPVHVVTELRGRGKLGGEAAAEQFALRREWTFDWTSNEPARPRR